MRRAIFLALFLAAPFQTFSQTATATPQTLPKDPRAVFAAAAPFYDFTSPQMKPWHLKATYQLYDDKSKPTEQGTYEFWWASPKVYRSTWTRPGATHSVWHTADGKVAFTASGEHLGYFEAQLQSDLLSPLHSATATDQSKVHLMWHDLKLSGVKFPCVSLKPPSANEGEDFRISPTYCFGAKLPVLRISYDFNGVVSTVYDSIVESQGKFLARNITIAAGEHKLLTAVVDTVGALDPSDPALIPPKEATFKADPLQLMAQVENGKLVKGQMPLYPKFAKEQLQQGTVLVDAAIGVDGRVKDAHVIFSSSVLLSAASLEAVSHWEFAPYTIDGTPVEVDKIITVNYFLSR
jgi:TonB family protein